jgi:flavorubredoxin
VHDYHLFHPEVALERLQMVRHAERLDLGDRQIVFLDAIWKDLSSTMWAYDTKLKMLFTVDMFGYIHHHVENVCGTMLHEMTPETALAVSNRPALPFTGMVQRDQKARVAAFRNLLKSYPVEIIISGHSGPLMGPSLEPNIEKLMHSMETSPPQMLQSGAKA